MIKTILSEVYNALSQVEGLNYVTADLGQLDNPLSIPSRFPCVLIDLESASYADSGRQVQQGTARMSLRIADRNLSEDLFSEENPDEMFDIFELIKKVSKALCGIRTDDTSALSRTSLERIYRNDDIREFRLNFSFGFTDYDNMLRTTIHSFPPKIECKR